MGWLSGPPAERKALGLQRIETGQNVIQIPAIPGAQPSATGALYPDSSYTSGALTAYGRNELVYACIRKRAKNLPQSVLRVYPGTDAGPHGDPLESHPLRRLIMQPNDMQSEVEFQELSVTYYDLGGNLFWLIDRGLDGRPAGLWPMRPDLVRIFPVAGNPRAWSYGYVLDPSVPAQALPTEIVRIARRDIIHIKYPNPLDIYFGQPPLRPAARAVALDNAATDFVDTLLRNYAVPGVVIKTVQEIDEVIAGKLKRLWKKAFTGSGRGDPAFLQAGMDVQTLGLTLRDLEFPDLRAVSESRICAVFDVPPVLVSAKVGLDRSTFTNYGEARKQLWEEGLFSLQRSFRDPVENRLRLEFAGVGRSTIHTAWDNSGVLALQESETARWERAATALARGGITVNDFRRTVGLDTVAGGDVFYIPAGVTIQDAGAGTDAGAIAQQAASYPDRFLAGLAAANGHGGR